MLETIQKYGPIEGFLKSTWMTDWYMGDPTRVYYPPLIAWILGGLAAITGDVFIAYRVFVTAIWIALSLSVYHVGIKWSENRWVALVGAILAVVSPYTLRTVFSEGNLPRALVIIMLPWMLLWTKTIVSEKQVGKYLVALSILWALALTTHVMQAAIFVIVIGFFVIALTISSVYIPLRRSILAFIPIGFGGVLAAFYLFPAYSHIELGNVPYLPPTKVDLFSIDFSAFSPIQTGLESLHIGSISLLLAFAVVVIRGEMMQRVLLSLGIFTIFLAFGNGFPIYRVVPLNQMLLPERFLNATAILIPLAVAASGNLNRRKYAMLGIGLLLVLMIEFPSAWRMVHMRPVPADEQAIAQVLAEQTLPGRVASLTTPSVSAPQIFLSSEIGGRDHVSGWGLENTPHQDAIRRLIAGLERSPDYVERVLSLWHSDYVVTRPNISAQLPQFEQIVDTPSLVLWERETAAPLVQALPDNRMLIIGDNATSWLFSFPFASEGYTEDVAAYDADYLNHYSVIGLNRFSGSLEGLEDWVTAGNTLIVDLSGYDPVFDSGYTLFGVQSVALALNERTQLHWSDVFGDMPDTFPHDMTPWIGATYLGLDNVLASVQYNGQEYPLIGQQKIGEGTVWYIGFNLLYWLDITGQSDSINQIVDVLLADTGVDRSLMLPTVNAQHTGLDASEFSFQVDLDQPTDVVLSMTYFPRWIATMDGSIIQTYNHEHLMAMTLPAGQHTISLAYHPYSNVSLIGIVISALGLGGVMGLAYWLQRHPLLAMEDRANYFYDRHATHAVSLLPEPEKHTTCPACGNKNALVGAPTERSYPFVSITCPECGYEI